MSQVQVGRRRRMAGLSAVVAMTMALALSACGSDGGDDGAAASPAKGGQSSGADAGRAAAQKVVKEASAPVKFVDPGGNVDVGSLAGKSIWYVTADYSVPFVQQVYKGAVEAAAAAGVKVKVLDGKGQTSVAAKAVEQAIAAKADAIIVNSVNLEFIKGAVAEAKAAKIPVVGVLNTDAGDGIEDGAAGEVTLDYVQQGKLLAAYAAAKAEDPVKAIYLNIPSIPTFVKMGEGLRKGFDEYCSSDCSLKDVDLELATFKTQSQTQTTSQLARDPKLNWIFAAYDGIAQFIIPSIATAGKADSVQVGSINAATPNLKFIQSGKQAVDVGNNNKWLGWASIDRTLRAMTGAEPAVSVVPLRLFTKENLEGADVNDEDALFGGVDYRGEYKTLWGK